MIRCDVPMRRSKEKFARETFRLKKWKCTKNCESCICGMKLDPSKGCWEHYQEPETYRKKGGRND